MASTIEVDLATLDGFITELPEAGQKTAMALVADAIGDAVSLEAVITGLHTPALVGVGRRWAAAEIGVEARIPSRRHPAAGYSCCARRPHPPQWGLGDWSGPSRWRRQQYAATKYRQSANHNP